MVVKVTGIDDFKNQLKDAGDKLVVVDFFATWCGPCKVIAPKVEKLSQDTPDVVFLKVDVDECEELTAEYQVSCMPTFMFFKGGERVDSFSGASEERLLEYIAKHN